jgi:hypothetical protein
MHTSKMTFPNTLLLTLLASINKLFFENKRFYEKPRIRIVIGPLSFVESAVSGSALSYCGSASIQDRIAAINLS